MAVLTPAALADDWTQGGYASRTSVPQGGSIAFHIATATSPFSLQIVNLAKPTQVLATVSNLTSAGRNCSGLWETGCGWPVTTQFTIPATWPSGYYAARFPTSTGTRNVIFVVRAASPGASSPIVVVSSTHTYLAYNPWGGKSIYPFNSTDGVRGTVGSYERPYADNNGLGRFPLWEEQFVRWMDGEGRAFDVITDEDLEDPAILSRYKVAVLVGHSEYWSLPARQNVSAFQSGGGHLAIFGGNTMWWQVRFDPASRRLTCYKDAATDPRSGTDDDVVTVNWFDAPVYNPENFVIGSSFRHGGYANVVSAGSTTPKADAQRTPYKVTKASSWVFDGTGVTNGQLIGQAAGGIETDGVVFNTTASGDLEVDGSDGAPLNFEILATLPADEGYAVIGMFTRPNGATVFNTGTRDWSHALLAHDTVIEQVTRNVLDRLGTGLPQPYQPRTTPWQTEDLFNTPSPAGPVAGVLPNWGGSMNKSTLTSTCAHEGALGLQLTGSVWTQFGRPLTADGTLLDATEVELWVNADGYTQSATYGFALIELAGNVNGTATVYGEIEAQRFKNGMMVHGIARRLDGTVAVETPWATLGAGWRQIHFSWRSPGTIQLQVGSDTPVQADNPYAGGAVNLMQINFPGSNYGFRGPLCIDELRLKLATGSCLPPAISMQPASSSITAGQAATLSVSADGTGPFTYQWYTGVSGDRTSPVSGATSATTTVRPENTTSYWAAVTNACGTADSNAATITVTPACTPPSITAQPQSTSITSGQSTTLSVSASGSATLTYQWFSGNTAIANATSTSITVSPTSTTTYRVRVANSCGTVDSDAATVTVTPACTPPSITSQPQSTSITSGQSTTLSVSASGSATLTYQWFSGNTAIANATSTSITVSPTSTTTYRVRVANSCGTVDSDAATVTVTPACTPPSITSQPQSTSITSGQSTTLSVSAGGSPTLTYQWYAGNTAIANATSPSITVSPTGTTTYRVRVANSCGTVDSDAATVTVTPACTPPSITGQPQSTSITSGQSTTLSVSASGSPTLTYQWYAGNTAIANATSPSITVSPTSTTTYRVRVTNSCGTADSNSATVTVQPPPASASPRGDFNLDGRADVFWRNNATGGDLLWFMNGGTATSANGSSAPLPWRPYAFGDFNGDGRTDVLWRHPSTGETSIWLMNGASYSTAVRTTTVADTNWLPAGTGDFDGNGRDDIFWHNSATGGNSLWLMNGTSVSAQAVVAVPAGWDPLLIGDFDGDGRADVFWRNRNTGETSVWLMNGAAYTTAARTATMPDQNWQPMRAGDFSGDGRADLFWLNRTTGATSYWMMNGITVASTVAGATVPTTWTVRSAGDYSGDGRADLFWWNASTGETSLWIMNGTSTPTMLRMATMADRNWQPVAVQ